MYRPQRVLAQRRELDETDRDATEDSATEVERLQKQEFTGYILLVHGS